MRWVMVMISNCIAHHEVDLMKSVKFLWSFIEDCAKFIFCFCPALFSEDHQSCVSLNFQRANLV